MYQFIHIEDYSINKSKKTRNDKIVRVFNEEISSDAEDVRDVIAEAKREANNIPQTVKTVEEPILLYGVDLDTVEALANEYHEKTKIKDKNGKEKKLRNDANVLIAGVISLNRECENFWDDYKEKAIDYLKEKYGHKLKCVVEHTDEPHPHMHFYVIQDVNERFEMIHDGRKAMLENKDKLKREQNRAYKKAMREFQEDFYSKVSFHYGLMKDGPKRRREDRSTYFKNQREIQLLNKLKKEAEEEIKNLNNKVKTEKEKAYKVGFLKGIKKATDEFNDKNYFNKFIFSISYNKEKAEKYDLVNKKLAEVEKMKNDFVKKYSEQNLLNKNIKRENEYLNEINEFLTFDEKQEKSNEESIKNDREAIIREVEIIEREQQQLSERFKQSYAIELRNRERISDFKNGNGRFRRSFLYNLTSYVRNILTCKLFERFTKQNIEEPNRREIDEKIKQIKGENTERTNIKKLEL